MTNRRACSTRAARRLDEAAPGRYGMHDLIEAHALTRCHLEDSPLMHATTRLSVWEYYLIGADKAGKVITPYRRLLPYTYQQPPQDVPTFTDHADALEWLGLERSNLIYSARAALDAGHAELAWHLADRMWPYLLYTKMHGDRRVLAELGQRAAERWGEPAARATMLMRVSRLHTLDGEHDEAQNTIADAVTLLSSIGDAWGVNEAQRLRAIAEHAAGEADWARRTFDHLLAANREVGDPRATGLTLIAYADLHTAEDRPGDALALLLEADTIFESLAEIDPYNGARVKIALARAYLASDDLDNAADQAGDAAATMGHLGSRYEQARASEVLAAIARRLGDTDSALRSWQQVLAIYRELGAPRARQVQAEIDSILGD